MYVGMNRETTVGIIGLNSVPHVRGDEPRLTQAEVVGQVRSPCTWG